MQVKTVLNRVHQLKVFVYGKGQWVNDRIEVEVRPRKGPRPVCSGWGRPGPGYGTLAPRHFHFVPLWAIHVIRVCAMRRVDCGRCGVTVEQLPWGDGKRKLTRICAVFLATIRRMEEPMGRQRDALSLPDIAECGGLSQGEKHHFLAGHRADVVVQATHIGVGYRLHQRFQYWPGGFDQLFPHLFQQVAALVGRKRLREVLFGGGQDTLEPDDNEIAYEVGMDVFRTASHVVLLKTAHSVADGGFDFALSLHRSLARVSTAFRQPAPTASTRVGVSWKAKQNHDNPRSLRVHLTFSIPDVRVEG